MNQLIEKCESDRSEKVRQVLDEISTIIETVNNLGEIYERIHGRLSAIMDVRNFYIAIFDIRSNKIRFPFFVDEKDNHYITAGTTGLEDLENIIEYSLNLSKGSMTAMVIEKRQSLRITKQELLAYCQKEGCQPSGTPPEVWLGAPMISGSQILGVVAVQSYTQPDPFIEDDLEVLNKVSQLVSIAVKKKIDEKILHRKGLGHPEMLPKIREIFYLTDSSGAIVYTNLFAETMLPIPLEAKSQKNWFRFITTPPADGSKPKLFDDLIHADDRARVSIMLNNAVAYRNSYQIEYRIKTKSSKNRWVLEKGRFNVSDDGHERLEGVILDIHERKRAELTNQVMFNITNAVNTTFDLDELYHVIHRSLNHVLPVKNFYIALYDKETDSISFPYDVDELGNDEINMIHNASKSASLTGEIILTGKPLLFTRKEAETFTQMQGKGIIGDPAELWLGAPLKTGGEVIGAMVTQSYSDQDLYDEKDVDAFISIADQIAIAIQRKRNEEVIARKERQLRALLEISNAINTTQNTEELYQSIHQSLKKIINLNNLDIALYNPENDRIVYEYSADEHGRLERPIIENASRSASLAFQVVYESEHLLLGPNDLQIMHEKIESKIVWNPFKSWLGLPLRAKNRTLGAIVIQDYKEISQFDQKEIELLMSVSDQIAFAIEKKQAEVDLAETQKELIEYAHKVGMADIANATLHNIGNILNSVKVSTEQIDLINKVPTFRDFSQTNELLKEKLSTLDPPEPEKAVINKIVDYYGQLEKQFAIEKDEIQIQVKRLNEKINLMTDVITTQQNFTSASFMTADYSVKDILEDAIKMKADMINLYQIQLHRYYQKVPMVKVQRTKLMHVLINLLINAKDAMMATPLNNRILKISIKPDHDVVEVSIEDNGCGIADEMRAKIFTHGFTTKEKGHGFGLHNSAVFLGEMKGKIWVENKGLNKGAIFTLRLPATSKKLR